MTVRSAAPLLVRSVFLAHRYLGMGLGLLMLMWCLSGIVMMYVPYPALNTHDRVAALAPIDWTTCCTFRPEQASEGDLKEAYLEMLGAAPLLRLNSTTPGHPTTLIDLRDGRSFVGASAEQARVSAANFGRAHGFRDEPVLVGRMSHDQWTVEGGFRKDSPLFKFAWTGSGRPVVYVSSRTGAVVQWTVASQRFWNWLGSIPHWIYFTALREQPAVWNRVVIYISLAGSLLTLFGLYLGVLQTIRMRGRAQISPYQGFLLWHHLPGLMAGLFILTWVVSGLISMNPWGFLDEDLPDRDSVLLGGEAMSAAQIQRTLASLRRLAPSVVSVRFCRLDGSTRAVLTRSDGSRFRLDEAARPNPLGSSDLAWLSSTVAAGGARPSVDLLHDGDAYYFPHHNRELMLPVYRLVSDDSEHARYYIDSVSGLLLARIGAAAREYRWLHQGAHRLDFIRLRPGWDLLMLTLLLGVATVCGTGAYLGLRRLNAMTRD